VEVVPVWLVEVEVEVVWLVLVLVLVLPGEDSAFEASYPCRRRSHWIC
jgi:hypothetical protein